MSCGTGKIDLADQHALAVFGERGAHRAHDVVHFGLVFGVRVQLPVMVGLTRLIGGVRRIVAELRVLDEKPQHVDTKAVDAVI